MIRLAKAKTKRPLRAPPAVGLNCIGLVNECLTHGPQAVSQHGRPAVVIISEAEYHQLKQPKTTLADFFLSAPRVELATNRDSSRNREVEL